PSAADRVSGVVTRTYVIVEDTDLIGDVICDVASNTACFSFGAPDVELRLNGFSITGKADPITGCGGASFAGEHGITTNSRNNVGIRGPGLVQRFRMHGVLVAGSTNARVEDVISSTNCAAGIIVAGNSFETRVDRNTATRNGSTAPGLACGGI
ncbi:MAG: hypothetical protein ACRD1H_08115, partial [Vicinamibacterales bacterium]